MRPAAPCWLKDTGYWSLELLQTNTAWYNPCVAGSFPGKELVFYCLWCISQLVMEQCDVTSRGTYILTSQDFSWLQNGQVNWVSRLPVIFFLGGGFLFDFLRPISSLVYPAGKKMNCIITFFFFSQQIQTIQTPHWVCIGLNSLSQRHCSSACSLCLYKDIKGYLVTFYGFACICLTSWAKVF